MRIDPQQLKLFLLDAEIITEEQFKQAQEEAKQNNKKIDDILIDKGFINQEDLIKLKAYILGVPFVSLEKEIISPEVLKIIPESVARSHNIVAFRKNGSDLEVAMLDPEDLKIIDDVSKTLNLHILPRLTNVESIKNILKQYQKTLEAEFGEMIKIKEEGGEIKTFKEEGEEIEEENLLKTAEEVPIIRIVDTFIKHAILERASDIHIEPAEKEIIIRYRIDGILRDAMILPQNVGSGIVARIKVLSDLKLDEHRLPQDGRFKVKKEDYSYSVRVSIIPVFHGEKIVLRLLPETLKIITLEELGFEGISLKKVKESLKKPLGMILITGPTGSGKTTTLYAMMAILNKPGVNIATVEDPIEYQMPRVNQTQVNPKIGFTFAAGLRSLVRQDPDIIMVGEIRDNETASLAVNAALTGHLVLSTLHTTTAAGTIPRLIDMKIEPFLISSTLNIVMAQRLVRRIAEEKEKYKLKKSDIDNLGQYCDPLEILKILRTEKIAGPKDNLTDIYFYRPKPSKSLAEGYKGRVGIYELLPLGEEIKNLITARATSDKIQAQAKKEGMRTMIEDGFIKAAQGITSLEEVLRVIIE